MKKIKIIIIIFSILFSANVFAEDSSLPCSDYKGNDENYSAYCGKLNACDIYDPTKNGINIIKAKQIPFQPIIGSMTGSNAYMAYLNSNLGLKIDYIGVRPLEQAKTVYVETENAVYNCAILGAKKKVSEKILTYLKSGQNSNIKDKINSQIKNLDNELKKCNQIQNASKSYKEVLLENLTYHYCNYRLYLNYLSAYPTENPYSTPISSKVMTPGQAKEDAAQLSKRLNKQTGLVEKEIAHSKLVYNQAFMAYNEFESNYGVHTMLLFIYDDYVQLKNNLGKLLTPISQLAYKIPQAQKK